MDMQVPARSGRDASVLDHRRLCKIASSPHAYVRGSTARFYELLAGMPAGTLPEGPPVWICGDAHLGNLGALAGPDGGIDIQIRDLDQTVVANPAFDLVRLALSLVTAALNATLPGIVTARMMDAMADGYADGIADPEGAERGVDPSEIVVTTKRRALGRRWRHLSRERLKGKAARLPRGRRFFDLDADEQDALTALIRDPEIRRLVLALGSAADDAEIRLLDAAYWIKGCSSLGRLRYAALVEVLGGDRPQLALLDVKEAVPHLAPAAAGIAVPPDHAARVVAGPSGRSRRGSPCTRPRSRSACGSPTRPTTRPWWRSSAPRRRGGRRCSPERPPGGDVAGAAAGRLPGRPSMRGARQGNDRADDDDRLEADRADHPFHDVELRFGQIGLGDEVRQIGIPTLADRRGDRLGLILGQAGRPQATDEGVRVEREGRHGRRSRVRAVRVDRPDPDGSLRERGAFIPPGQAAQSRASGAVTRVCSARESTDPRTGPAGRTAGGTAHEHRM
ncbi:DUF2252 family protein [Methylobacterium mesophilicum]|uniref:DUF2252 family protein n=2 Tax=Methylobacterium TaxID=407 RepID=UPI002F35E7DC